MLTSFWDNTTEVELIGLTLSLIGTILSFISVILVVAIFVRNQKNYYQEFLTFLDRKKKALIRAAKRKKIDNAEYLVGLIIGNVRFFAEDFFVNFAGEGSLKYQQYRTIKGIYKHIKMRLIKSRRVFNNAVKRGYPKITIRIQVFEKFNELNEKYFKGKVKNAALKKTNENVYTTLLFRYDSETSQFIPENRKPTFYKMGDDLEFKKNVYYIFSTRNKIEGKLEGEDLEKKFFFIACSYSADSQHPKNSDKALEKQEELQEDKKK